MTNGWTPTPTNPERLAYDAERRAYWEAKSLAYAMEHDVENLGARFIISGGEVLQLDEHLEAHAEEDMPF
jgi:hypothetical protein